VPINPITPGGTSFRRVPQVPVQAPPPVIRPERTASRGDASVSGQIVSNQFAPRANARVVFVSLKPQEPRRSALADTAGRFSVALAEGPWMIYLDDGNGQQMFHSQIEVRAAQQRNLTVVSR
jgi:hypothetical protein